MPETKDALTTSTTTAKKAGSKKAAAKKAGSKKAAAKKVGSKKAVAKKVGSKKAVAKKAGSKKAVAKKAGSKKAVAKKAGSMKAAAKKVGGKKATAKTAAAKTAAAKKAGGSEATAAGRRVDAREKGSDRRAGARAMGPNRRADAQQVASSTPAIRRDTLVAAPVPTVRFAVPISAMLAAIGLYTLWGGQTVAIKYSLVSFPPLWSAFWRFVLGVGCLAIICWVRGISLVPDRRQWKLLWGQSWIFVLQAGTMNWGIQLSTASMSSIIIGAHPLFASVLAPLLLARDPFSRQRWIGLMIAFGAMSFAILSKGSAQVESNVGIVVLLFSSLMLGARIITGAKLTESMRPEMMVFWQMTLSLPFFFVGAILYEPVLWSQIHWSSIVGLLYQGVIVAGLNFVIAATLVQRYSPSVITSFGFLVPITGVFFSALILDETAHLGLLVGLTGVGLGLYIIARSRKRNKPVSKTPPNVAGVKTLRTTGGSRTALK